ncbi:MAG TPA: lyase family protein, partial [Trueperaceae bacterium]|nr:lyase family protein [Trueperaceae bacterium]
MIDRYSTPEMKELWSEANRYRTWLRVELAALEAFEDLGDVPAGTSAAIRDALRGSQLDEDFAQRVAAIEEQTRHDIVAFTRALTERVGEPARFVHYGLTSTDVVDTAQNTLLVEAVDLIA